VLIEADAAGGDLALTVRDRPASRPRPIRRARPADRPRPNVLDGLVRKVEAGKAGSVDLVPAPVEPAAVEAALDALAASPRRLALRPARSAGAAGSWAP
jgi:hypothetical protein